MKPTTILLQTKSRLKAAGYQVQGWALARGFKPDTVSKFFQGKLGMKKGGTVSEKIISELQKDGFWPTEQKNRRAA